MTADAFARWMALSFPWVHPDGADWRNLRAAWDAATNPDRAQIAALGADIADTDSEKLDDDAA